MLFFGHMINGGAKEVEPHDKHIYIAYEDPENENDYQISCWIWNWGPTTRAFV